MAPDQETGGNQRTLGTLARKAVEQTLMTMAGGTFGVMLVGGFETRADFWLFLLFCALFTIPGSLVCGHLWPSRHS